MGTNATPRNPHAHDPDEQSRVGRILASLSQSESRDELGLGGVRDSLADRLFPGTSTIQTRLRYFFIVPWCFRAIEQKRVLARNSPSRSASSSAPSSPSSATPTQTVCSAASPGRT